MLLTKLLASLPDYKVAGRTDIEITGIEPDSRKVKPGNLFVAIRGLTVDSHNFIPQAIEKGAVAVIGERNGVKLYHPEGGLGRHPFFYIQVPNSREALGILASAWFDHPSRKLKVIGVTGTEGKTTTCDLIYHILKESGKKAGLISTIAAKIGDEEIDTGLHVTNPEALPLQELLAKMLEAGCEYAILETTSIGLDQDRVAGVEYKIGVLTNITRDHLDYHGTIQKYRVAKAILFRRVKVAILNKDDSAFDYMKQQLAPDTKLITYAVNTDADLRAVNIQFSANGTKFDIDGTHFKSLLLGKYNVLNALAATATAQALGINNEQISNALASFTTPRGRLERIDEGQNFTVFVDFAHTPNSLDKVLGTLRNVLEPGKKLITVYGSAGARDQLKRPAMGTAGAKHADITIFTADDPRNESVEEITNQLVEGALKEGAQERSIDELTVSDPIKQHIFIRIPDRREAIELAIKIAHEGDIVALLGKGHEKSLAIGKEEIPWSDQEEARKAIRDRK